MNSITDVGGIRVGHYQRLDPDASLGAGWACGVTVVLPPPGTVGAVDCRGGALEPARLICWTRPTACASSTPCCSPAAAPTVWPPPMASCAG